MPKLHLPNHVSPASAPGQDGWTEVSYDEHLRMLQSDLYLPGDNVLRMTKWVTPTLAAGWTGNVQYMVDRLGIVWFRGTLSHAAAFTGTAFTLTPGSLPGITDYYIVLGDNATSNYVQITSAGAFIATVATGNTNLYTASIRYNAEN